jgi:hypothetical protein
VRKKACNNFKVVPAKMVGGSEANFDRRDGYPEDAGSGANIHQGYF